MTKQSQFWDLTYSFSYYRKSIFSYIHSNHLILDIWIPVSTLHNLGFIGDWKHQKDQGNG